MTTATVSPTESILNTALDIVEETLTNGMVSTPGINVTNINITNIDHAVTIIRNAEAVRAQTYIEEGVALKWILEGKHYGELGYTTFEQFCAGMFNMSRQSGYNYIAAAEAAINVKAILQPDSPLPSRQQALELSKATPDQQKQIAATTDFGNMPVRKLQATVQATKSEEKASSPKKGTKAELDSLDADHIDIDIGHYQQAVKGLIESLVDLAESFWKARKHFSSNRAFNKWLLKEIGSGDTREVLNPCACEALSGIGKDLKNSERILKEYMDIDMGSNFLPNIWRGVIKKQQGKAGKK